MAGSNNSQKYNELGDQIKNSVLDALSSGDFTGLSDSIARSVNVVIGDVGDQISRAAYTAANSAHTGVKNAAASATAKRYHDEQEARIQRNKELRAQAVKRASKTVRFNDHWGVSTILGIILGAHFTFYGVIGALAFLLTGFELGGFVVSLVFAFFGGLALYKSINKRKVLKFARRLKELVKEKMYTSVSDIEAATGRNHKTAVRDIKKVLAENFFPEGFLDEEETTFMASKAVYDQYLESKKHQIEEAEENLARQGIDNTESVLTPEQLRELNDMMSEGSKVIVRLHELNDEIPGEAISAKLDRTESLLQDIFGRVKEHPDQMKNCHKLMDYYLPTMLKLVEAYAEYDKVAEPGSDIVKAKDEIEKTIDTINGAFSELLNKLFRDSVWDVTADARVLQSMLGQDGLAKEE